jgi:hypothetical protein
LNLAERGFLHTRFIPSEKAVLDIGSTNRVAHISRMHLAIGTSGLFACEQRERYDGRDLASGSEYHHVAARPLRTVTCYGISIHRRLIPAQISTITIT